MQHHSCYTDAGSRSSALEDKIIRYARVPHYVLITGERGTGKTTIARRLHELGPRSRRDFVSVNCASFTAELLESELFGYEKGAFTGAADRRVHRRGIEAEKKSAERSSGGDHRYISCIDRRVVHSFSSPSWYVDGKTPSQLRRTARALSTGAAVTFIEDTMLLGDVGGVGAFLRYRD